MEWLLYLGIFNAGVFVGFCLAAIFAAGRDN